MARVTMLLLAGAAAFQAPGQQKSHCSPLRAAGPSWAPPQPGRGFGVEIELISSGGPQSIKAAIDDAGEVALVMDGVNRDTKHKAWKIVPDLSLPAGGVELVSPILRGPGGRRKLVNVIDSVNADDEVRVNKDCGYHVHVDLTGIKFSGVKRICQNWVKYEDAIDLVLPPSRRGDQNKFCRSVRQNRVLGTLTNKQANDHIGSARRLEELQDLMNPRSALGAGGEDGRYYKLNLRTGTRNTIEFRAHSGTSDKEKLKRWVNFAVAMVENSATSPAPKSFLDHRSPKYKFKRLFAWVTRGKVMYAFYDKRRRQLARA